jgi:hypothetical protein
VVRNDFTLTPGSVSESITVEAAAQVIKTDDATISAIISTRQLSDLPMMGRDPMSLATTTHEIQNSMSLDGISIMNNLITTTPTRPMVETVQVVPNKLHEVAMYRVGAGLGHHVV